MKLICDGCAKGPDHGQLWSGVRVTRTHYVEGHYECVLAMLGPELVLKATQRGYLPLVPDGMLIGGRLPKFQEARPSAFDERPLLGEE